MMPPVIARPVEVVGSDRGRAIRSTARIRHPRGRHPGAGGRVRTIGAMDVDAAPTAPATLGDRVPASGDPDDAVMAFLE
jgi:hypothetical protein